MVKQSKKDDDNEAYKYIGMTFAAVSVVFLFNEEMRGVAIAFFAVAVTFLIIGFGGGSKKSR